MKSVRLLLSVLCCLSMPLFADSAVDNYIVRFNPEITVDNDSPPCQGVLLSSRFIATSEACASAVREQLEHGEVSAWNTFQSVGQVHAYKGHSTGGTPLLLLEPASGLQRPLSAMDHGLLDYSNEGEENEGEEYALYFRSEKDRITEINLVLDQAADGDGYYHFLPADSQFPQGAPVLVSGDSLLCLWAGDGKCRPIDSAALQEYLSDDSCRVLHYDCTHAKFTSCENGLGQGTCTNSQSGDNCTVFAYPNGYNASRLLTCNNKRGCEEIFCPQGCLEQLFSCRCIASYKMSGVTDEVPEGCIKSAGSSGGDACRNYIIGTAAAGAGFVISTMAAIVLGIYLCAKRRAADPESRRLLDTVVETKD